MPSCCFASIGDARWNMDLRPVHCKRATEHANAIHPCADSSATEATERHLARCRQQCTGVFGDRMTARGFPIGLTLVAAGAMSWLLSHQQLAWAAPAPQSFRVQCPRELPVGAVPVSERADGWAVTAPGGRALDSWGILTGAPDEQAYLKPTESKQTNRGMRENASSRWVLAVPHGYEHWMYCSYGSVLMARRIPPDAVECIATTTTEAKQSGATVFVCR